MYNTEELNNISLDELLAYVKRENVSLEINDGKIVGIVKNA